MTIRRPRLSVVGAMLAALALVSTLAAAQALIRVDQKNRLFSPDAIAVTAGDTVQFANADPFLHQIFVNSPRFSFDSAEQAPGEVIAIKFPVSGTFEVHCHIHPLMRLSVTVR